VPEYRAHDREAPISCEGRHAIAVFWHGDVMCARCGETLLVYHAREVELTGGPPRADVLQWSGAGGANGASDLGPSAA
jgi:hypothetical protein